MQFVISAVIALLAARQVSAAIVTEVVHVTQYVYQDVNVYVDQNGVPVTTVSSLVSTNEIVGAATPAAEPVDPDTLQHSHASHTTSYASIENNYQYQSPTTDAVVAPTPTTTIAPVAVTTTSSPAPAPAPAPPAETTPPVAPVPPVTTSSPAPAPPVTTSSPAPAPSPTQGSGSGSGSGSGQTFSGDATYYDPGLGACGVTNSASDFIAALNVEQFNSFGSMSNGNPVCGKKATLTRNGKSVTVTITDKCPGCSYGDLDLSPAAFDEIASEAEGRVAITWSFDS